jgi:protoporphyrin/coproporphyrin ferrochelatase
MSDPSAPIGVLVMAHGTPARPDDIAAFYTRIRRGRPPTPEQLTELEARYAAIGGTSPLNERTAAQVAGIRTALASRAGHQFVVWFGAKHTTPLIEDGAAALRSADVSEVIGLVLTPHGSSMGSQEYFDRAEAALGPVGRFRAVPPWFANHDFVSLMAERVNDALSSLRATDRDRYPVIFTAHSLPERVRQDGDTYPDQLESSARLVAEAAGLPHYRVAWQSAGRTPEPWLGPDVRDVVSELASGGDVDGVVVCPIGFVADHLEVLYDLDVELAATATRAGLRFARTASLNDDPRFLTMLADVVCATAVAPN